MTSHGLKSGDFLYTTVSSLKGYLRMNRVHFRSSKEGSHPEQLQINAQNSPYYSKVMPIIPKMLSWPMHIGLSPGCRHGSFTHHVLYFIKRSVLTNSHKFVTYIKMSRYGIQRVLM